MMKNLINTICVGLAWLLLGCTAKFGDYNTNHYAIYEAVPSVLLAPMIEPLMYVQQNSSQHIDQMVGALGGYLTCSNRWGGYNFDTFNASDDWNAIPFNKSYESLVNIFDIEKATNKSGHYYAMAILLKAAVLMRVADCYGSIPYSSIAERNFHTKYDKAEDAYKNIIGDLLSAANILYKYSIDYPGDNPLASNDPIYSGDYSKWARLANSLALRAAVRIGDKTTAEEICASKIGLIDNNSYNALVSPGVQGNPYHLASVSWGDLRVSSSIADYMNGYKDPRLPFYFTISAAAGNKYAGMRSGEAGFQKSEVGGYSMPRFTSESKLLVFNAAEVSFLRAECALKNWNVGGQAEDFYKAGIRLSMEQYGIEADVIMSYINDDENIPSDHKDDHRGAKYNYDRKTEIKIKWGADNDKNFERIITQKWIANYPMGLEAWAEYRRTGYPELAPALDNLNTTVITDKVRGMRRLRYPYTERDLNRQNYEAAVSAQGGVDNESVDLFWAKKK